MNEKEILDSLESLLKEQPNRIALLSNTSAFLYDYLNAVNWVGFYLYDGLKLTVGPFQGKVACAMIELGQGVCGEAALLNKTLYVKNVLEHQNHIACDANSRSELVIPLFLENRLYGVLDIDSTLINRFKEEEIVFLEKIIEILIKQLTFITL